MYLGDNRLAVPLPRPISDSWTVRGGDQGCRTSAAEKGSSFCKLLGLLSGFTFWTARHSSPYLWHQNSCYSETPCLVPVWGL